MQLLDTKRNLVSGTTFCFPFKDLQNQIEIWQSNVLNPPLNNKTICHLFIFSVSDKLENFLEVQAVCGFLSDLPRRVENPTRILGNFYSPESSTLLYFQYCTRQLTDKTCLIMRWRSLCIYWKWQFFLVRRPVSPR